MTSYLVVLILLICFSVRVSAQTLEKDIKIELSVQDDTIGVIDPIDFILTYHNSGCELREIPLCDISYFKLEYKQENAKWIELEYSNYHDGVNFCRPEYNIISYHQLQPDSSFSVEGRYIACKKNNSVYSYYFSANMKYRLRATIKIPHVISGEVDTLKLVSNEIVIGVMPYMGESQKTYQLLKLFEVPHFFYKRYPYMSEHFIYGNLSVDSAIILAEKVINEYPKTKFSVPILKLLVEYYLVKAEYLLTEDNKKISYKYLDKIELCLEKLLKYPKTDGVNESWLLGIYYQMYGIESFGIEDTSRLSNLQDKLLQRLGHADIEKE